MPKQERILTILWTLVFILVIISVSVEIFNIRIERAKTEIKIIIDND